MLFYKSEILDDFLENDIPVEETPSTSSKTDQKRKELKPKQIIPPQVSEQERALMERYMPKKWDDLHNPEINEMLDELPEDIRQV